MRTRAHFWTLNGTEDATPPTINVWLDQPPDPTKWHWSTKEEIARYDAYYERDDE